jgi:hypothetical protein
LIIKLLLIGVILFSMTACGTKQIHLTEANKAGIPEFFIDNQVKLSSAEFYPRKPPISPAAGIATAAMISPCRSGTLSASTCQGAANAYGNAVGSAFELPQPLPAEAAKLEAYHKDNKIDLANIVQAEFIRQLSELPRFSGKINANAKAKFKLEVLRYGVMEDANSAGWFSPILIIQATLTDAKGDVIWEQTAHVNDDDLSTFNYQDFYASPASYQTMWTQATAAIVKKLIMEMD